MMNKWLLTVIRKQFRRATLFFVLWLGMSCFNYSYGQFDIQVVIDNIDTIQNFQKKASSYLYVAEYYLLENPENTKHYASKALELSVLLGDSSLISDSYRLLGISNAELANCGRSDSLLLLGFGYTTTLEGRATYLIDMGAVFTMCGNLKDAYMCYDEASYILQELNDYDALAGLNINLGVTYSQTAQFYKASKSYHKALEICDKMNDEERIPIIYQNLGEVMAMQSQFDKAVGYYNSALNMFIEQNKQKAMAGVYLNLGQIYIELKQWDIAKSYLNKSYVIDTTLNLINYESIALKQLGVTYLRVGKLDSAEELIRAAIYRQDKNGLISLLSESQSVLAEILYEKGKYDEAAEVLNKAIIYAEEFHNDRLLMDLYLLSSKIFEKQNNHQLAYQYLLEGTRISDSVFNIGKINSIMNLELAYQTELKEKQISELQFNETLQQQKFRNKSFQNSLLIVSVVLIFVIMLSILLYWRRRQMMETQLRDQKFLKGRFEAEEKAKDKIASELHDDIGGQMIGLIMQLQSSGKLSNEELNQLRKVYQEVRRLSHSLDEPLFKEIVLQDKLHNYFSELKNQLDFSISFIDDFDIKWSEIREHQEIQRNIYRIVQELITNTAKYAAATDVEIQLIHEKKAIVLIYEDDGVGMNTELNSSPNFNTIRKRLEMFNGTMDIRSESKGGFFVRIAIPFELL